MDRVSRAEVVLVPAIVLGVIEAGFRLGSRADANRVALEEFLARAYVAVLPITANVARVYGQIFAELRRAGTPVSINDMWIAATTIDAGAHLVTFDRDFDRIGRLEKTILDVGP